MSLNVIEFEDIPSTNTKAKELAIDCDYWTIVVAKKQTDGHGTKNKNWFSPQGGLYFSIIMPPANINDLRIMTMLSAFAVAIAIKNNFALEPMIKLPNDVYINGRKFCGILTENIVKGDKISSVIGIGINTNICNFPSDISNTATSIANELKVIIDNRKIMEEIIENIRLYFNEIKK
ncbi:biotin--[acetyl-CoA-carboxylase] ligase [bacterium]|nr:biotin--[acetyl-CoA-carboxylase] ligase [bacterium]